jgi:hypothetical protein
MKPPDKELRRVTDAWHDGTISAEDALRLEQRLRDDGFARQYFFEISEIEASLSQLDPLAVVPAEIIRVRFGGWWKWAAVFVVGFLGGALTFVRGPAMKLEISHSSAPSAAVVTGMRGVEWAGANDGHSLNLSPGSSNKLASGLIEVTLASGTRALLEGPVEFEVSGANSMRLKYGKLVADVPKGAEGFNVIYPNGEVIDHGTEFGMDVARDGKSTTCGVFRGEIECRPQRVASRSFRLLEDHAAFIDDGKVLSVPFDRSNFVRDLPSREFAWEIRPSASSSHMWSFDVSHLIYKSGRYLMICKWLSGDSRIDIGDARLFFNDKLVAEDSHQGAVSGSFTETTDPTYNLIVPDAMYRQGKWELRVSARMAPMNGSAAGTILFEEGLVFRAAPQDFIGTWEYLHDGQVFQRTFNEDGSARLTVDGKLYSLYADSRWHIEDGSLVLEVRDGNGSRIQETHILRNADTLIFTNRPYRNAVRVQTGRH